jgi:hypothetical protein
VEAPCGASRTGTFASATRRLPGRYPDGEEGEAAHPARCTQAGPGLWMLTTRDGSWAGFARRADGVTITLTGYAEDKAALRHATMAAHTELWPRIGRPGTAPVNFIFL